MRGSQIAIAGEGDAASEAGSTGSGDPPSLAAYPNVADMPLVNVSPGVKLVIGEDEETMKSVRFYYVSVLCSKLGHLWGW